MRKLKKRIAAAGLVLTLCITMVMPVMAGGVACPSCKSTNTDVFDEMLYDDYVTEICKHGYGGYDDVVYRVYQQKLVCSSCKKTIWLDVYKKEMSRICHTQRR